MDTQLFDFVARPRIAWLTVNRACNFRCPWCYSQPVGYAAADTLPVELGKRIIEIAKDIGVEHIKFIGGESTIYDGLSELNSTCKDSGITTCLVTNACRFGDDAYWMKYLRNPCDEAGISVKGASAENFKIIGAKNLYSQTSLGIKRALEYYQCGVSTVLNDVIGVDGLKNIARKCKDWGATSFSVSLCNPLNENGSVEEGNATNLQWLIDEVVALHPFLDKLYGGRVNFELYLPLCLLPRDFLNVVLAKGQALTICNVHDRSGLVFNTNGNVLICNELASGVVARYGEDFTDARSLLYHLNGAKTVGNYRELLRYPSAECSICSKNAICKGGCLVNWLTVNPSVCKCIQ